MLIFVFFKFSSTYGIIIIHPYRPSNSLEILLINQLKFQIERILGTARLLLRENNGQQYARQVCIRICICWVSRIALSVCLRINWRKQNRVGNLYSTCMQVQSCWTCLGCCVHVATILRCFAFAPFATSIDLTAEFPKNYFVNGSVGEKKRRLSGYASVSLTDAIFHHISRKCW